MNKIESFNWRNDLKKMHSERTSNLLQDLGYETKFIDSVSFLTNKKRIKKDKKSQLLEDVVCLVFLQYYLEDFIVKNNDDKIINILKKTWNKMFHEGQGLALQLSLFRNSLKLIKKALKSDN